MHPKHQLSHPLPNAALLFMASQLKDSYIKFMVLLSQKDKIILEMISHLNGISPLPFLVVFGNF